jgi:uncharacterized protein with HEPN domain
MALEICFGHEYRRIDPEVLWSIIADHLGTLDNAAAALLESLGEK